MASGESQNHKIVCLAVGLFARTVHCALWVPKLDTIFVGVRFHLTAAEPAWATLGVVLGLPVSQFPFRTLLYNDSGATSGAHGQRYTRLPLEIYYTTICM